MTRYVLNVQTVSDIITNSSSEVFICKSENPQEKADLLREVLSGIFELYRKGCGMDRPDAPEWFGRSLDDIMEIWVADEEYKDPYWDYSYKPGDIVVMSTEDNSIPSFMMDLLEDFLGWENCKHVHLG